MPELYARPRSPDSFARPTRTESSAKRWQLKKGEKGSTVAPKNFTRDPHIINTFRRRAKGARAITANNLKPSGGINLEAFGGINGGQRLTSCSQNWPYMAPPKEDPQMDPRRSFTWTRGLPTVDLMEENMGPTVARLSTFCFVHGMGDTKRSAWGTFTNNKIGVEDILLFSLKSSDYQFSWCPNWPKNVLTIQCEDIEPLPAVCEEKK